MNALFRLGSVALLLGLAACASEPVHYHTLLAPSAGTSPQQPVDFLIDVLSVGIPSNLDQAQLVVRQGTNGVTVLDGERWASPLGDEVHGALSAELTQRLGTQNIAGLPQPSGKPVMRIKVQIRRFDAWPGQRVQLDANWSLGLAGDAANSRLVCSGHFDEPADVSYSGMVTAQQRAIAVLAARIDADARRWERSRNPGCALESSV
ncbi:PqiC family protein [Paraburkholderia sp. BL10I2N1]|uniref:PqiC family protein n=1 Tax=Paraburkholderia sp. BL10I2N1 TaxID=1938796 RepID=UPI00105C2701|nr:PqiC family protein [Paraburkholderia sp. BL10I2N1]TDN58948.1 hypothetical protein B0G77_8125 [Paraburkholderia sp. BL10I2N1]